MRFLRLLTIAAATWPATAFAAADPAQIALKFADEYAVPRFQALAAATHAQADAWDAVCAERAKPDTLKAAYVAVSDAWADIEYIHIGPAAVALRAERFNWWVDKTDATGKAMTAMLAADPATLTPDKLAMGSVAGQGLPILERLLYAKGAKLDAKHCAVGAAVARGQAAIADGIVADWTAADGGARAALAANTRWRFSFADAKEAASVIMTDLVAGLEGLKDFKVARIFHDDTNAAGPRLAEAPLAKRSLIVLRRNLAAIHQGLGYFLTDASDAQRYQLDTAFADAEKSLGMLEQAKGAKAQKAAAERAIAAFAGLSQQAMAILPAATGLTLGFNNLDGD